MKTVLITGTTGYIGSRLARAFLRDGMEIVAPVRNREKLMPELAGHERFLPYLYDGRRQSLDHVFSAHAVDAVFHLAAQASAARVPDDIDGMIDANIRFGAHLAESMLTSGCRVFINTGTYWQMDGDGAFRPMNFYAAAKQGFQDILSWYCLDRGVLGMTLMLQDVYGPGDMRPKLFNVLKEAAAKRKTLDMTPGEQIILPVHIDDVITAFRQAHKLALTLEAGQAMPVYDVAGASMRLKDLVLKWIELNGADLRINWGGVDYRPGQIMNPYRGNGLPGWSAETSIDDGIKGLLT